LLPLPRAAQTRVSTGLLPLLALLVRLRGRKVALPGILEVSVQIALPYALFKADVTRPDTEGLKQPGQLVGGERLAMHEFAPRGSRPPALADTRENLGWRSDPPAPVWRRYPVRPRATAALFCRRALPSLLTETDTTQSRSIGHGLAARHSGSDGDRYTVAAVRRTRGPHSLVRRSAADDPHKLVPFRSAALGVRLAALSRTEAFETGSENARFSARGSKGYGTVPLSLGSTLVAENRRVRGCTNR
jgi:hypothetical protein